VSVPEALPSFLLVLRLGQEVFQAHRLWFLICGTVTVCLGYRFLLWMTKGAVLRACPTLGLC
jgi:hypothetical protein